MRIDKKHKLEKVVSREKTQYKTALQHINIMEWDKDNFVAVVTDGRRFVSVPIEMQDPDDKEGLIPVDALKESRKGWGCMRLEADTVTVIASGIKYERHDGIFPNVKKVIPDGKAEYTLKLNAKYLYEMAQAMGNDEVFLEVDKDGRAMRVFPCNGNHTVDKIDSSEPFGVLMLIPKGQSKSITD